MTTERSLAEGREAGIREVSDWLKDEARKTADDLRRLHSRKKLTPRQTEEWETLIETKVGIANAILALIDQPGKE